MAGPREEVVALQDKVHNLQRQMTELIQDAASCRKNEGVARQQSEAVGAELRSAHDQMATMQRQVVAMQEDAHQQQRGNASEVTLRATKVKRRIIIRVHKSVTSTL